MPQRKPIERALVPEMNLSNDQRKAIAHRGSHLQIIACAGSGKTEVMARRVTALVDEGVRPAAIIAFTFTERAAASLKLIPIKKLAGTDFGRCYAGYVEMLYRYHFLSFGQLISEGVKALRHPDIFKRVHDPLQHLLVDEYQDINP